MAGDLKKDVTSLVKQHPDWDNLKIFNALKDKGYDPRSLAQEIATIKPAVEAKTKADKTAADKAKVQQWATPQELTADILNRAGSADPTAGGNTLTTAPLSPLTGQPITVTPGAMGGSPFSSGNLSGDFYGNQAQGVAPRLSMSPAIDKTTGKYYVQMIDPTTGAGRKVYVLGDPNNPKAYQVLDYESAASQVFQQYAAKGPTGIKQLKQLLADNFAYKNTTVARQAMAVGGALDPNTVKALQNYLDELTTTNFNLGPTQGFISVGGKLTAAPGTPSLAGTRTSSSITYTPDDIAAQDFNLFVSQQLGRGATARETSDYTKALHAYEKAHPERSTTTTDSLGIVKNKVTYTGATAEDKKMIMVGYLHDALVKAGVDPDAISKAGGAIAKGMQEIQAYAAAYGLGHFDNATTLGAIIDYSKLTNAKATNADTLKMMAETLTPGGNIDSIKTKIREQSKLLYKPLASFIDSGGSVKDIADQFNSYRNKYLETVDPTDVFNPDIQKGLMGDGNKIMGLQDYIKMLKGKPEWAMTQNAREEAANYANTILRNFGLVG